MPLPMRVQQGRGAHVERDVDLHETDPRVVQALMRVEPLPKTIWEPACGPGAIVKVLRKAGHVVRASDLRNYNCPGQITLNFLTTQFGPKVGAILTNPPFMHADEFARLSIQRAPKVVLLLRLAFLESDTVRNDVIDGGKLARVYVFRNRLPMMHRANWDGPRVERGGIPYAWFVWERHHRGPWTGHRISWQD
jgi:hypothetical protein